MSLLLWKIEVGQVGEVAQLGGDGAGELVVGKIEMLVRLPVMGPVRLPSSAGMGPLSSLPLR